ncbi:MAG: AAA family ATPase [Thermoleophilia bacterium]|nr:AAA family ATPase [Thermoleophilia bacterium]
MEFRILGPLEVSNGGRPLGVNRPKQRALLIALLLRAGHVVSIDRLLDDLWGERPPPSARASLQNAVSMLRKLLGTDVLLTRPPGYVLDVEPERIDAARFERLVEEARGLEPVERAGRLREALALWRGPALADVAFEPFAEVEADRLEELRAAAREELAEAELALGRHEALVPELEAIVAEHPFRERPRAQLMLALYRSGRQADALQAYQAARRFLDEELGLEPSPQLQELQHAILRQDPAVDAPVTGMPALAVERRATVTVLFADLVGSTELAAGLDPEAYRVLLRRYFGAARAALERHGGAVEKFVGDAVVAVFGVPQRHEDDALRAVRAAADVRDSVAELGAGLEVRLGVNTGEAVVGGETGALATGYAVNVAAKLEQSAEGGEILLGGATYRLVREAVAAEPVGRPVPAPVRAFRLLAVAPQAEAIPRRPEAPLVGRRDELSALLDAFDALRGAGGCCVVTVVGEAGIGKTRLARELAATLGDGAELLVGRCVSYGQGATYLPVAEVVRRLVPDGSEEGLAALLGDAEDAALVARRVRELTGLADSAAPAQEGFWAVRRLLEGVAARKPVLLVLDDVHWAEPTLLDLVAYLGEREAGAPVLVLCLARPDLREARSDWPVAVELAPLRQTESAELVANLGGTLSDEARARVAELAEGNALFAEQLLAHAAGEGEEELASVPLSLEALLASRLDRLPAPERELLECAAVLGRLFEPTGVGHLCRSESRPPFDLLVERSFVRAVPDGRLAFHHGLIRDVAYAAITKRRRSELHELAAEWLDDRGEADELVGYHLEQAHRNRVEAGQADRQARRLAEEAGERLSGAGTRVWRVGDARGAANLLDRAVGLLPEPHPARPETLGELGGALWALGDVERAEAALDAARSAAHAAGDRGFELRAEIDLAYLRLFFDPASGTQHLVESAEAAIPVFEAMGEDRHLARTWLALAHVYGGLQRRYAASEETADLALRHYRRVGWVPATCLRELAAALYCGPTPVSDAIARCRKLLTSGDRSGEAIIGTFLGGLEAMRGRFSQARGLIADARAAFEELGWTGSGGLATMWAPVAHDVEVLAGDLDEAERLLREGCSALTVLQDNTHLPELAGQLASLLCDLDRREEGAEWAARSRALAAEGDVSAQLAWRSAEAKLAARRGAPVMARTVARDALALSEATDALNARARLLLDAAEVERLAGREEEAGEHVLHALELYRRKGNRAAAKRARALLGDLQPA